MARGKPGSGVPPVASSSSHLRRSSRNAADRKQGALPADGKQSSLRVAAATVKSTNLGANAAAASDGKQTAMGVSATTNLDSAPAAGRTEENLQYALYPIDSGTDAAPAAERTEEAEFVQKFYCSLNFNLLGLHRFYSTGLLWNFSGRRVHLKTAKEIKSYMYGAVSKRKFHASHFDSLSVSEKNSVFLTVHGSTKSVDNQSGTFVHSILLDLPGRLILNDSLTVTEYAAKVGSPSKLQDNDSKDQCGLCKEIYDSTDPREWVCCDWCDMWIHVECDPTCIRDMKTLKSSKYRCPKCKPKHKDVLTVNGSLKGKSVEPIIVSCFGMDAIYKAEERMIKCLCRSCSINPMMMSLNKWEKHTKCVTRNWKKSIKLKGTETLLAKFIEDHLDEIGRSSVSTELHQASSAEASQHPAVEASQLPAAASSLSYAMSKIKHSQKTNVCILYDYDRMKSHQDKDNDHEYEIAARIFETWNTLKEDGVMDRIAREAFDSADPDIVLGVHDHKLLKDVDGLPKEDKKHDVRFSLFSSKGTREAIYSASGAAIRGVDLVMEGYYKQAFALIRPPGHHAGRSTAEGFCFFNNIAISANHAINHHHTEKVLVVDIDVHHGNGTQEIFYDNNKVLFVSTHGNHLGYPKSKKDESAIGEGKGEGYNVNIPLTIGFNDADICYAFDEVVLPVANEFKPDIVLVSAGYDAGVEEKIGECNITAKGFGTLVHKLLSLAHGRMVLALEGGYNVTRLPICVSHTIRALLGDEDAFLQDHAYGDEPMHDSTISTVNRLKENLRLHWDVFKNASAGPP